jgi:hypothetical protein
MKLLRLVCVAAMAAMVVSSGDAADREEHYAGFAKWKGWREEYNKGKQLIRELKSLSTEQIKEYGVKAHRDEKLSFVGSGAPPGGTNDLILEGGYYLRVVNPEGEEAKDLRPHAAMWEVMLRGTVLQVLPENKIIVLEVGEKDWEVLETW